MPSIIGRRAAPRGVDKKSVGKSVEKHRFDPLSSIFFSMNLPLIKAGIDLPVKNPTQSSVNELQLKSRLQTIHQDLDAHRERER